MTRITLEQEAAIRERYLRAAAIYKGVAAGQRVPSAAASELAALFALLAAGDVPALLDELERLRALCRWRPIDSATKDGTTFLLSMPWGIRVGCWSATNGCWIGLPNDNQAIRPTHWIPLPDPPSERAKKVEGAKL